MTKEVISATVDTPVSTVAALIFDKSLTGMPVLDDMRHVVGILTEYDLLSRQDHIHIPSYMKILAEFKIAGGRGPIKREIEKIQALKTGDVMTHPVVTIAPDTDVAEAARIFSEERINPLPVVDKDGVLVGIVSRADIVKLFKTMRLP